MNKKNQFDKFINKKKGSAIKEEIRQSKKTEKRERTIEIEKRFEAKRQLKQGAATNKSGHYLKNTSETSGAPKEQKKLSLRSKADKAGKKNEKPSAAPAIPAGKTAKMPLNKYIAHSGLCSRRDAADLVKKGVVTVNDVKAEDPGIKVTDADVIKVNGKKITPSRHHVYILLNKPKDYITTSEDPQGRKTVLDLIKQATSERVYPIGRLDRNTSGVLLFTNDGDLAQTLSHPKYEIKKVYQVGLDKPLTAADFDKIQEGVTLDDGLVKVDALAYSDARDKTLVGVEIHSGRNRIVRRLFEKLGYDVKMLDRVVYAGLTKKDVPRGKWRFLSEAEVRVLKHFNKKKTGKAKTSPE